MRIVVDVNHHYPASYSLLRSLNMPIELACSLDYVLPIFYLKYFGNPDK